MRRTDYDYDYHQRSTELPQPRPFDTSPVSQTSSTSTLPNSSSTNGASQQPSQPALSPSSSSSRPNINPGILPSIPPYYQPLGTMTPLSSSKHLNDDSNSSSSLGPVLQTAPRTFHQPPPPQPRWDAPPVHRSPSAERRPGPTSRTGSWTSSPGQGGSFQYTPLGSDTMPPPSRKPSGQEEVEAGLALAGMGMSVPSTTSTSPGSVMNGNGNKRKDSTGSVDNRNGTTQTASGPQPKKTRKDEKPNAKDTRKSCSECRRLKAKCDRVFPCSNCRRRGCALVCPDGDLSCMQGKRLVLASTEQLHDRIAQLEAALFQAHSKSESSPHPLLAPQFLDGGFANFPLSAPSTNGPNDSPGISESRRQSSTTSLATPNPSGSSSQRMAVESLLLSDDFVAKREPDWVSDNAPPAHILNRVPTPDNSDDRHAVADRLRKILAVLPPREETRRRAHNFWESSSWYQRMLRRREFNEIYEPAVYAPTAVNPLSPHKLACVLMVLCLDAYFDLSSDTEDPKVADYWDAVQQCFDTRFGWAASVAGVQALALAAFFVGFGWKGARAPNFYWVRQMTTAAQQLGLQKEPHPSIPQKEADFRRRVFHETFMIDCLMSINHGQRTSIPLENIETRYPSDIKPLYLAKYEYMRRIMYSVIDIGLRPDSAPATADQIRAVEEEMCKFDVNHLPEFHCPAMTGSPIPDLVEDPTKVEIRPLAQTATSMAMYKSSLFLYRPSLRRLVARLRAEPHYQMNDFDKMISMRTFETCRCIVHTAKFFSRIAPRITNRTWSTWVQVFSAAVSIASVAIWCAPQMNDPTLISQSLVEFNDICQMMAESGAERARGVQTLIPALQQIVAGRYPHLIGQPSPPQPITNGEDMLFALLGGAVDAHGPGSGITEPVTAVFSPLQNIMSMPDQHQMMPPHNVSLSVATSSPSSIGTGAGRQEMWNTPPGQNAQSLPPHQQPPQHQQQSQIHPHRQVPAFISNAMMNSVAPANSYSMGLNLGPMGQFESPPHLQQDLGLEQTAPAPAYTLQPLPTVPLEQEVVEAIPLPEAVMDNMSSTELWTRLQTFYEPTPWWGIGDASYDISAWQGLSQAPGIEDGAAGTGGHDTGNQNDQMVGNAQGLYQAVPAMGMF